MHKSQETSLSVNHCISYAAPVIVATWLHSPIGIIQGIYAKYHGLSLTAIAAVILMARLIDTFSDPLAGYCGDRYYQRTGTRKPFMLVGGLLLLICAYFLYVPPLQVTIVYFAIWFIAFYLAETLFGIAHLAWASDLAATQPDKTRVYSIRAAAGYIGAVAFYTIPLLPLFASADITPETLRISVIAAVLLMLPLLLYSLKATPDGRSLSSNHQPEKTPLAWRDCLKSLVKNRPFLLFMGVMLASHLGIGLWYGLIFYLCGCLFGHGQSIFPDAVDGHCDWLTGGACLASAGQLVGKKTRPSVVYLAADHQLCVVRTANAGECEFSGLGQFKNNSNPGLFLCACGGPGPAL